ncbi:MAG TPA: oligosaccharide flippase family protein, partial [Roseiflexaceae bacterium]|nr:oligosaccharide flippase family protein [Roseiflexaceae bacterium]
MSISGNRVIKNTSVLLVSQIITWGLTTALTLFLPRYIGPEGNGVLAIASSVWAITAVLISFGMDIYLMKMIAREPEHVYTWL